MEAQALQHKQIVRRLALLEWFIPHSAKAMPMGGTAEEGDAYRTALLIIQVFLISILSIVCTNIFLYTLAESANQHYVLMNLGLGLTMSLLALLFIKTYDASINAMGNAYASLILVSAIGNNMITGLSWEAPYLPLVMFLPVWAFLICDIKSGLLWSCATASVFWMVFLVEPLGLNFPQVLPETLLSQTHLAAWLMTVSLVAFCVYAYQSSYKHLSERLAKERSFFAYHADHDTLTGLANRSLFYRRAAKAIDFALEEGVKAAVIYIDLDDFKQINDNFGHQVGDELLISKAEKIKTAVRQSDTVARLGGDEFGVVLHAVNTKTIERVMNLLNRELNEPVTINGISHKISASLGLSIAPDHGVIIDRLLQHADSEMYAEKRKQTPGYPKAF